MYNYSSCFRKSMLITLTVVAAFWVSLSAHAQTERMLVVGDSWAAGTFGFEVPKLVFDDAGLSGVIAVGGKTALSGSRADQWASNHEGKLDILAAELEAYPTIDMVHLSIGGNDFLKLAQDKNLAELSDEERDAAWRKMVEDTRKLVEFILAVRPNIKVVLCGYDYLDPGLIQEKHGLQFHGIAAEQMNEALVEYGRYRYSMTRSIDRCEYVQNFGLLQYEYGNPPHWEAEGVPYPGKAPTYDPFPGGNPKFSNTAEAMPDGVHPMPEGYIHIFQNCFDQFYSGWLRAGLPADAMQSPAAGSASGAVQGPYGQIGAGSASGQVQSPYGQVGAGSASGAVQSPYGQFGGGSASAAVQQGQPAPAETPQEQTPQE